MCIVFDAFSSQLFCIFRFLFLCELRLEFYFILFFYKFIYWLRWAFVAACGLSLVAVSGGLLFVVACGLLIAVASLVAEYGL